MVLILDYLTGGQDAEKGELNYLAYSDLMDASIFSNAL